MIVFKIIVYCGVMSRGNRDDPAVKQVAMLSNNVCPICWMPLCVGEGPNAEKWKSVQYMFKGKPAFSISKGGTSHQRLSEDMQGARPVFVFGINSNLSSHSKRNYQKCHYIHYSFFGNGIVVNNIWTAVSSDFGMRSVQLNYNGPEARKTDEFYQHLCEERGIFASAVIDGEYTSYLARSVVGGNWNKVAEFGNFLFSSFFAGCVDCNSKMTIAKYVERLFALVFNANTYTRCVYEGKRVAFNTEQMIHYLMLSGVLNGHELRTRDGNMRITVDDPSRANTWTFRYIVMWCAMNIMFCKWSIANTRLQFKHHVEYLYAGVVDFYLSVCLFAMHLVNYPTRALGFRDLTFLEFHFYYSSCYPFFLSKYSAGAHASNLDLSSVVLKSREYRFPLTVDDGPSLADVKGQLACIYSDIFGFWKSDMHVFSTAIHCNFVNDAHMTNFFISRLDIKDRAHMHNQELDWFINDMSSSWYWFHFKQITMPRISSACKRFDVQLLRQMNNDEESDAIRVWRRWYRLFSARVHALGSKANQGLQVRTIISARMSEATTRGF